MFGRVGKLILCFSQCLNFGSNYKQSSKRLRAAARQFKGMFHLGVLWRSERLAALCRLKRK